MPDLDLGPNDYRTKGPDGRWRIPDDPKLAMVGFFACLGILGFIWWNRDDLASNTLFWIVLSFAGCGGGMLQMWLRKIY